MLAITNCTNVGNKSDKMSLASMPSSAVTIKGHMPVLACQPEGTTPGGWSHCVPGLQGTLEVKQPGPMMHDPLWIALVVTGSCSLQETGSPADTTEEAVVACAQSNLSPWNSQPRSSVCPRAALPHDRPLNPCRQFSCPLQVFPRQSRPSSSILPRMTYMVSSPLIISTLTFEERKCYSPRQPMPRAEFHDLSSSRGDFLGPQG